jgi:NDP-sugar pyrophosphorylase family protein
MSRQAVILAGGLGTRLWPLTKNIPKPMVPIRGVPYLEYQLRMLREQSFTEIVLLIGYLGDQIESHFGTGEKLGLRIQYAKEDSPLGTGGALRNARELLADSFVLLYGDSFLPIRYDDVLNTLLQHDSVAATVVVYDNRLGDTSVNNNIALDSHNLVVRYDKTTVSDPALQYVEAGVLAVRRSVIDRIPSGKVSFEQEIYPQLIAEQKMLAIVTQQRFYDIGTPDRLRVIEDYFAP